jgi:putative FmdB family regulatory protein
MPIYEYRCSSCGHELEALQKLSDAPLRACPSCNGETLVKLVSAAGFQLKGSGWYATDFKGSGSKPAKAAVDAGADGKSEAKAGSANEAQGGTQSEAKGDTKGEAKGGAAPPPSGNGAPPAST